MKEQIHPEGNNGVVIKEVPTNGAWLNIKYFRLFGMWREIGESEGVSALIKDDKSGKKWHQLGWVIGKEDAKLQEVPCIILQTVLTSSGQTYIET